MPQDEALQTVDESAQALDGESIRAVPIEDIEGQVQDIQKVMERLMQEGTHYDDVTGDGRNSLLQPGAEKLCLAFKFAPSFESERTDIPPEDVPNASERVQGHREYEVECKLHHRPTGQYVGSGKGSCSTLESKYRYRTIDEETDVPIPGDFWDSYDKDAGENMGDADFSILEDALIENGVDIPEGAEAGVTKNDDGDWRISIKAKGENPDIADTFNTVLKMAEKRALVNAVKRATAASDIFTQDTEDLAERSGSSVQRQSSSGTQKRSQGSRSPTEQYVEGTLDRLDNLEVSHKPDEWYEDSITTITEKLAAGDASPEDVDTSSVPKSHPIDEWPDEYREDIEAVLSSGRAKGKGNDSHPPPNDDLGIGEPSDAEAAADRKYSGPEDAVASLCPNALDWDGEVPEDRRISEKQVGRMYAIAKDHEWKDSWLDRLVKDELGFESKSVVPYGDPYDEICEALEDEEVRFWMSRDVDTPDMFEEQEDEGPYEEGAFEDDEGDPLPF